MIIIDHDIAEILLKVALNTITLTKENDMLKRQIKQINPIH